jgi:Na+/proline symporter
MRPLRSACICAIITFRGVFANSLVFPIIFSLMWRACTSWGAISGVVLGQIFGVIAWLVCAHVQHGRVDMSSMKSTEALLAANLASLLASPIVAILVSN